MMARKALSGSLRWQVLARDGFMCRYCGARAGQDGVVLHVDHIISVADGGDNSFQNLLAACQQCNGGKGAKSLQKLPDSSGVADRMNERAASIKKQAKAIRKSLLEEQKLKQQAVNLKCYAYRIQQSVMQRGESTLILSLCREFGSEVVSAWYAKAYERNIPEYKAIQYVCGIARKIRLAK